MKQGSEVNIVSIQYFASLWIRSLTLIRRSRSILKIYILEHAGSVII